MVIKYIIIMESEGEGEEMGKGEGRDEGGGGFPHHIVLFRHKSISDNTEGQWSGVIKESLPGTFLQEPCSSHGSPDSLSSDPDSLTTLSPNSSLDLNFKLSASSDCQIRQLLKKGTKCSPTHFLIAIM